MPYTKLGGAFGPIQPVISEQTVRDFICVDPTAMAESITESHPLISSTSIAPEQGSPSLQQSNRKVRVLASSLVLRLSSRAKKRRKSIKESLVNLTSSFFDTSDIERRVP